MTRTSRTALLALTALVAACIFSVAFFAQSANATITTSLDAKYQNNGTTTEITNPVAGSHPDYRQTISLSTSNDDDLQRLLIDFPPGLIGNPNAIAAAQRCTVDYTAVTATSGSPDYSNCPASSKIGTITARATSGLACSTINMTGEIYLLQNRPSAAPEVPTYLGIHIEGGVRINLSLCLIQLTAKLNMTAKITVRPSDQGLRIAILDDIAKTDPIVGGAIRITSIDQTISGIAPSGNNFLTMPTRCDAWDTKIYTRAYSGNTNATQNVDGTNYLPASSSRTGTCTGAATPAHGFTLTQTNTKPGAPTGLRATLTNTTPASNQPAYAKTFSLLLPAGMKINPAIGARLGGTGGGCTEAQFLVPDANNPVTSATPTCPTTSQVGNVAVTVPEITGDLTGRIYLGEPRPGDMDNGIYRLYIYAIRGGVSTKFQGTATANAGTGRVTVAVENDNSYYDGLPQFNYTKFDMDFNTNSSGIGSPSSGAVANPSDAQQMLVNPQWCGSHTATATVVQWTSQANENLGATLTTAAESGAPCAFYTFAPSFSATVSDTGAGKHPNLSLNVARADRTDNLKNMKITLPDGFAGSAIAAVPCEEVDLSTCPLSSKVGTVAVAVGSGTTTVAMNGSVYNVPTDNDSQTAKLAIVTPAVVGPFQLGNVISYSILTLGPSSDGFRLVSSTDLQQSIKGIPILYRTIDLSLNGIISSNGSRPFLQNPSKCSALTFNALFTPNGDPNGTSSGAGTVSTHAVADSDQTVTGCSSQAFNPTFSVTGNSTTSTESAKPTGFDVNVGLPQTASGVTTGTVQPSTFKNIRVTLPLGMEINPAFANGLTACSTALIDAGGSGCPSSSVVGVATVNTPLLTDAVPGTLYIETPGTTPTTRYKLGLVLEMPGGTEVVHGTAEINGSSAITGGLGAKDSGTGQIVADFPNLPDVPYSSLLLSFNGTIPMFVNPSTCATQTFNASLTPTNGSLTAAARTSTYGTSYDGAGAACPGSNPFAPTFGGSVSTTQSAGNPNLTLNFTRPDKNRELRNVSISLPTGLVAATTATPSPHCDQATAAAGNCAANQAVGSVSTAVGSGADTLALSGTLYNVIPSGNEPARLQAVIPVLVGPYDLGKLSIPIPTTLRSDFGVDATAQLPVRYEGIAIHLRTFSAVLNGTVGSNPFVINPSKCQSNTVNSTMTSDGASPATVAGSFSFTTDGCTGFGSTPTLAVTPSTTTPADPVGLTFNINSANNNPTIKRVQIAFPSGMEINPAFGTGLVACATATINAGGSGCASGSQLATVAMTTPLLSTNPTGKVYLETPGTTATTRYKVAMVIDLPGQKLIVRGAIQINGSSTIPSGGTGAVDAGTGQITADFDNIPDLGFTTLSMAFNGGANAMVVNPETCSNTFGATFTPNSNTSSTSTTSAAYTLTGCGAFGFDPSFTASVSSTTPAGNPNLGLNVTRNDKQKVLKSMSIHLPTGLVANTSAVASPCEQSSAANATCATTAAASQVGTFSTSIGSGTSTYSLSGGKIFQVVPGANEPVRFAAAIPVVVGPFDLGNLTIPVTTSIRADYGIDVNANLPQRYEGIAVRLRTLNMTLNGTVGGNRYITNPSKCQSNTISADFKAADDSNDTSSANNSSSFTTTGCSTTVPAYNPTISASVNPVSAGNPTALTLGVQVPANSATTGRVQIALPTGLELNPGVGNGLVACSTLSTDASSTNPCKSTSSNLATVSMTTPLLPGTQAGEVYLETPGTTASTRYKLALVIHLPGRDMVIRGGTLVNGSSTIPSGSTGSVDTGTGQVIADFPGIPDLGFTNMSIAFNSAKKLFVNPKTAGTWTVNGTLTPNSVATTKSATATFATSGGTTAVTGWNPTFSASLTPSPTGSGSNPDLTMNVGNPLGMQELKGFDVDLPVGLAANTSAVPTCSQANADAGTCLPANEVGTVSTTFGSSNTSGENYEITAGKIYNVVPSSDQPARLQAIVPVQVGPFALGNLSIPIPTALNPDMSVTASATLPTRYEGIAVRVRAMQLNIEGEPNSNKFLVAPSKCGASNITGTLTSDTGSTATVNSPITVNGCPRSFSPNPTLTVSGTTGTTAVPTGMTLQFDSAASNPTIGSVVTTMPLGMTLNPAVANLNGGINVCSTAAIDALKLNPNATPCPAASKVGDVSLVTPLLAGTKTGSVYLEEPGNTAATRYRLVMIIDLPGTKLVLRGSTTVDGSSDIPTNATGVTGAVDSGNGRITATFESIPDLGFTQLRIAFSGGANALFTNSETAGSQTVAAQIAPQSGGSTITANGTFNTVYGGSGSQAAEVFEPSFAATFSTTDAAANPDVTIDVSRADYTQQIKEFDLKLPPGLVANTVLTPRCEQSDAAAGTCANNSVVGSVTTQIGTGGDTLTLPGKLHNVIPDGSEPARLAVVIPVEVGPYNLGNLSLPVTTQIVTGNSASDLSIRTHTVLPEVYEGVPVRVRHLQIKLAGIADQGTPGDPEDDKPFMINPSQCISHDLEAVMKSTEGDFSTGVQPFTTTNCEDAQYNPAISAELSTTQRGKPVGIDLGFQFSGNSSSTKKIVTTFPSGMGINPGVGNYGTGMTCDDALVEAGGAGCPSSSRLGEVALDTPLLPTTQTGALYLLPPVGNQAATRFRLGLFVDLPGAGDLYTTGSVNVDGSSDVPTGGTGAVDAGDGQVTATFDNLPDLQFNNLTISFKTTGSGEHALLTNPNTCGTFEITADMSPWARPTTSEPASTSFDTTDNVANCIETESADDPDLDPAYVKAEIGAGPDFNNPAGPAYFAGSSQPVTMTVNRPDSDKSIKRVKFMLPPGLVGSADAAPTCSQESADAGTCATTVPNNASQVGTVTLKIGDSSDTYELAGGLFNTVAPSNRPAKFTFAMDVNVGPFAFGKVIVPVDVNLDNNDYSLFAETDDMPQVFEGIPVRISQMKIALVGTADQGTVSTADDKVFMSNPRSCSTTLDVRAVITSSPGNTTKTATAPLAGPFTNCGNLNLDANTVTLENQPVAPETGHGAEHPTGLNVQVHQDENLSTQATLKELSLDLPGFRLSAPAANGLKACTASQLNTETCPAESRVGTAWLDTSLLPKDQTSSDGPGTHSLWGAVYLETPGTAADGSDRYKLAIQLTGKTLITIRGIARVNETTGEITTKFEDLPDIPFTDFRVELTGYKTTVGSATTYFPLLLNPAGVIGSASTVQADAVLSPHSGTDPVTRSATLPVDAALAKTFAPTTSTDISPLTSGGHPNAEFNISRGDGQEDIKSVGMQLPAGFLGSAAAVPLCPVASANAGSCNDQSKVGEVVAEIGQYGQKLTLPGKVYLTEGVGGDIAGMSIKVPAEAGPYDLGDFITQGRIQLRPSDHGISVNFADVPRMFKGVPTHIQNMDITLPGIAQSTQKPFLYNASDCSPFSINTSLTPYAGAVATDSDFYRATDCPARAFSPSIAFAATSAGDDRTAPSWTIRMNIAEGSSTLKSTTVVLPSVMTVNVAGIGDACPAELVASRSCPATSKIGTVTVDTPLIATPVTGTIYMAKSISGQSLPDLLIDIPAPIDMQIRGANSFITGGGASQIKSTFSNLPDLIWGDLTMNITGGPKGILGLRADGKCGSASSNFASHSGQAVNQTSPVTGLTAFCQNLIDICAKPTVKVSTKGAKKRKNKKVSTSVSLTAASNCPAIKSVRVSYPKGTKINKKLVKWKKTKNKKQAKAYKKNLKNLTGKAGNKKLTAKDFTVSGSNGLKFKAAFPANARSLSINTKTSAVVPSYKNLCGAISKKKYKTKKKYNAALKKCKKKNQTYSFEITNVDGTAFRYNYVAPAGSKFFK